MKRDGRLQQISPALSWADAAMGGRASAGPQVCKSSLADVRCTGQGAVAGHTHSTASPALLVVPTRWHRSCLNLSAPGHPLLSLLPAGMKPRHKRRGRAELPLAPARAMPRTPRPPLPRAPWVCPLGRPQLLPPAG